MRLFVHRNFTVDVDKIAALASWGEETDAVIGVSIYFPEGGHVDYYTQDYQDCLAFLSQLRAAMAGREEPDA